MTMKRVPRRVFNRNVYETSKQFFFISPFFLEVCCLFKFTLINVPIYDPRKSQPITKCLPAKKPSSNCIWTLDTDRTLADDKKHFGLV